MDYYYYNYYYYYYYYYNYYYYYYYFNYYGLLLLLLWTTTTTITTTTMDYYYYYNYYNYCYNYYYYFSYTTYQYHPRTSVLEQQDLESHHGRRQILVFLEQGLQRLERERKKEGGVQMTFGSKLSVELKVVVMSLVVLLLCVGLTLATCGRTTDVSSNILMVTMGGTKSHKVPFLALGRGLVSKGHNVTFLNAFPPETVLEGLEEVTPPGLVFYVRNYTNWDLLGARLRGEEPVPPVDIMRYGFQACEALLSDPETHDLLDSGRQYDLLILDGAYPECALGFAHHFKAPFMYINTVGFYTGSLSIAGNPTPYSVTPFFGRAFTDHMGLFSRAMNTGYHVLLQLMHVFMVRFFLEDVLRNHFGPSMPPVYAMSRNVSFTLQNAHATVSYPRPYLPNVAEVACIHCKAPKPLDQDLEEFIYGAGDAGFIYVSMGSSVRSANMPEYLRLLFVRAFAQLPYRVVWKWEEGGMPDLPHNVKLRRWLPQQDILGHRKLRAFLTHGGLLSMFETVWHAVPVVTMPVFCDHDANAAKAEVDGYALRLELHELTEEKLLWALNKVIHDPRYRESARQRSLLLRDQPEHPLERAVYWTEYVLRHKGAYHLQSPSKDLNWLQYYLVDVACLYLVCTATVAFLTSTLWSLATRKRLFAAVSRLKAD
uniref:UDP-glycosyltransferase n=1 Tax=Timema douglasi TaxID=61478 RepID=A0A7R8VEL4_TIMDO|nr:unnamed protein product [Timema douglasi]